MMKSGQHAALAAAFVISAQAVWADVTPEQVWQAWQDAATAQGRTVTAASTAMDGDTLTVTGITVTISGTDGDGKAQIDSLKFTDNGDGTVAIVAPDSFAITIQPPPDAVTPKPADVVLNVSMPGADITASGVPDAISYETDLPVIEVATTVAEGAGDTASTANIAVNLTDVTGTYLIEAAESGQNITEDFAAKAAFVTVTSTGPTAESDVAFKLSVTDIGGRAELTDIPASGMADLQLALNEGMTMDLNASYGIGSIDLSGKDAGDPIKMSGTMAGGNFIMAMAASTFHYDATSTSLALNFAGKDKTTKADFGFSGTLADFTSQLDMLGANWAQIEDFPAALKAGLQMSGGFALGASSFDFNSVEGDKTTKVKSSFGAANSSFAMDAAQMRYSAGTKAITLSLTSPEIPVPEVSVTLGELAFDLAMPIMKSATPAAFSYLTKVVDLAVPEALWGMIDPGAALPHDAATLIIDTKGTVTLTRDLMEDAMALAGGAGDAPLLNSLDLTQILLRVAGAEVTALGGFTFDNTDTTTIPDMPYPTGKVEIKALGVNALIDKLVAMGLVPEDQAMQGRMMMSMFANTSADKDEITSTLEFKDKHFFANGARLQ